MLIGSLLLILVAVALLGLGLVQGSNAFLVGSIAASLLAAVVLVAWARRAVTARTTPIQDGFDGLGDGGLPPSGTEQGPATGAEAGRRTSNGTAYRAEPATDPDTGSVVGTVPAEEPEPVAFASPASGNGRGHVELDLNLGGDDLNLGGELDGGDLDGEDPADEPAAQIVPPADAAQVARMSAPVSVVDGRPRYHLRGCVHLLGRESEELPVSEAVELGFTPCSLCEPDSALLADARRV